MDVLLTSNVGIIGVAIAAFLAGVIFLVFRMNPGPNYSELYRKQREQLYAVEETKQKKKEKPSKKKDKRSDKKEHPEQQSKHSSDHVDFSEKEDVKVVELDQPPQVEPEKVLASSRQPAKPILVVHTESEIRKDSLAVETADEIDPPPFVRSNSFHEIRPMDEVELHHKKQSGSPAKTAKTVAPTAKVAPMAISQQPEEAQISIPKVVSKKKELVKSEATEKRNSPAHDKKERKIFSKKDYRELLHQIEHQQLPSDVSDDTVQRLVDALLNHQNESKEWKSTRQDPMQVIKKNLADKEETIAQLKFQLDSALARSKELHSESNSWKTKCGHVETTLAQVEARYRGEAQRVLADAQREHDINEKELRELRKYREETHSKLVQVEAANKDLKIALHKAEERVVAERHAAEKAVSSQAEKVTHDIDDLTRQLEQAKKSNESILAEKQQAEQRSRQVETELAQLTKALAETKAQLDSTKNDLVGAKNESSSEAGRLEKEVEKLNEEIQQLKQRNEQLHQKNWTTIEGMNAAEKKFTELQQKNISDEEKIRKTLLESLPKTAAAELKDAEGYEFIKLFVQQQKLQSKESDRLKAEIDRLKAEIATLQKTLQDAAQSLIDESSKSQGEPTVNKELEDEVNNLREESIRLRGENANYSGVLNKTETMLKNLEDMVVREEKRWTEDRNRFEAERSEMTIAIRDLESKLRELQAQLEDAESEKSATISQLEETKSSVDNLTKKLALVQQPSESPVELEQQNGHQSEESASSPTPGSQQNGGQHEGEEAQDVGGGDQTNEKKKKKKHKKKANKVS